MSDITSSHAMCRIQGRSPHDDNKTWAWNVLQGLAASHARPTCQMSQRPMHGCQLHR